MAGLYDRTAQVIELATANDVVDEEVFVENIFLAPTAGGVFTLELGTQTISVTVVVDTYVIPWNRKVDHVKVTAKPAGTLYVLLGKKS